MEAIKKAQEDLIKLYEAKKPPGAKYDAVITIRDALHGMYESLEKKRNNVMKQYWKAISYACVPAGFFPSREQLNVIKEVVNFGGGGRYLLDIGTGTGETASVLQYCAGLKVKCFEPNRACKHPDYLVVQRMTGVEAIRANSTVSCVLGLFAPQGWALDVVKEYHKFGGDVVLVGGDDKRVGSPEFWTYLRTTFICSRTVQAISTFRQFPDVETWSVVPTPLYVFIRRPI